jgi:hypothetical protein
MSKTQVKAIPAVAPSSRSDEASVPVSEFYTMEKYLCARTRHIAPVLLRHSKVICVALLLNIAFGWPGSWAFDVNGYKSRAEATLEELNAKRLPDSKATLGRLDEMIAIGSIAVKEYAVRQPKYAKLMDAAIADSQAMKGMTDAQLEEKWGEKGYGGDGVGIPLHTLGEASAPRAYLELIVAPAEQYIYIKRWQTVKKARLLEQARDEAVELNKRLEAFPEE